MDRTIPHPRISPPPRGWTITGMAVVGWAVLIAAVVLVMAVVYQVWGL